MGLSNAEMARHYGSPRFAMYTVFTAIAGALVFVVVDEPASDLLETPLFRVLLGISGLLQALGAVFAEYRMSSLITFYQQGAHHKGELEQPDGSGLWAGVVPGIMMLPFFCAIAFWLLFLAGHFTAPDG